MECGSVFFVFFLLDSISLQVFYLSLFIANIITALYLIAKYIESSFNTIISILLFLKLLKQIKLLNLLKLTKLLPCQLSYYKQEVTNNSKMLGQQGSLVKYSTPVLVSGSAKTAQGKKQQKQEDLHHTQDLLGEILPPKEHRTDNGQLWVQTVLSTPATKIEVIQLHEQLDKRLIHRQAREIGLCPIRQELFDQCFDEIIRQITIDCRQRGLLLVKVRDEYRNQTKAYKNLYESSINHAMRRIVDSDERKTKMNYQISRYEKECQQLQRSVQQLSANIKNTKQLQNKKLKQQAQKHKKTIDEIKQKNQKLKSEIQNALQKNK